MDEGLTLPPVAATAADHVLWRSQGKAAAPTPMLALAEARRGHTGRHCGRGQGVGFHGKIVYWWIPSGLEQCNRNSIGGGSGPGHGDGERRDSCEHEVLAG